MDWIDVNFFSLEMVHIPIWLLVAGILVLVVPAVYYIYDAFCKPEDVNPGMVKICIIIVVNQMPMWFRLILTVPLFNVQIVNDCRVYISYIVS